MVMLELFSKSLKTKYKSYLCSKATAFVIAANFIAVSFPFVFAYRSKGFWLKHDTFYEQPNVRFKGEYLFVAHTDDTSNPIVCGNLPRLARDHDTCSSVKARETDDDWDGKVDEFYFSLNANVPGSARVLAIELLLTIDYRLRTPCPLNMQSAIILQESLNGLVSVLEVTSVLQVSQTQPLFCYLKGVDTHYNESVIQSDDLDSYRFSNIISNYNKRNITTHLSKTYKSYGVEDQSVFELRLRIRYPEHRLYYRPGFWQVMKWAWIQYFPVYIVFAWLVKQFKTYIFENRLVLFHEVSPLKRQQQKR